MFILSQSNIAAKLKISRTTVSGILKNYPSVSLRAINAVKERLRIYKDRSIAGFGFKEIVQNFTPTLSIINQGRKKIIKTITELLIETIMNPDIKFMKNIKIVEGFIWNDSIKKPIF